MRVEETDRTLNRPIHRGEIVWIQISTGDGTGESKGLAAQVVEQMDGGCVKIEIRQAVCDNGTQRTAVLTASVRKQDILPGNRISSCRLFDTTVIYTDATIISNQRWYSRLLSWIF